MSWPHAGPGRPAGRVIYSSWLGYLEPWEFRRVRVLAAKLRDPQSHDPPAASGRQSVYYQIVRDAMQAEYNRIQNRAVKRKAAAEKRAGR